MEIYLYIILLEINSLNKSIHWTEKYINKLEKLYTPTNIRNNTHKY